MSNIDAIEKEILHGMARLAWAYAWGNKQEENGRSFSGVDIYYVAPATPKRAKEWAKSVGTKISKNHGKSLAQIYSIVKRAGYSDDAEAFGGDLAHQALGTGINWTDRVRGGKGSEAREKLKIAVPDDEFYI